MKIRNGFVSNSSSSSFVCDICGEVYEGWDASEFECSVCPNEHVMCNEHIVGEITSPMDEGYSISIENCPICKFEVYSVRDMASYLEKTRGITRDEVFKEVKEINKRRKKLRNPEYITYVCKKFNLTDDILLQELRDKFGTYDKFNKFRCSR